jgi:Protein of unknown function (DUF4058)
MRTSPFPGMDPYLEMNPAWEVFHGWFIRKLAEQAIEPARELGCQIDVERSIYGQGPTGELVLWGEPDAPVWPDPVEVDQWSSQSGGGMATLTQPKVIHEVVLDPDTLNARKQEYIVVREGRERERVLAVVELLSFANKEGSYATKYREKRSRILASAAHFMEIDLLRAGENPSRGLFPELPPTPYFIYVARKTAMGRNDEGYPLRLQDPLPLIGLPLGGGRADLPLDLAAAFRSAYQLGHRSHWNRYGKEPVPPPPLSPDDQAWVDGLLEAAKLTHTSRT